MWRRVSGLLVAQLLVVTACSSGGGGVSVGSEGGVVEGPAGARLVVPAGVLSDDVSVRVAVPDEVPSSGVEGAVPLGGAVLFEVEGGLTGEVTVEVPFDPSSIPVSAGADPVVFVARWDEATGRWMPYPGGADLDRGVAWASTDELSIWKTFVWTLEQIDAFLADAIDAIFDFAGATADPPSCSLPADDAWSWSVTGGNASLLLACLEQVPGGVGLHVVNNRAYGVLLRLPEGAEVIEFPSHGSMTSQLWSYLSDSGVFGSDTVYLPETAEVVVAVTPGADGRFVVSSSPSDMTFGLDVLLKVLRVVVFAGADPADAFFKLLVPTVDCAVSAVSHLTGEATTSDVVDAVKTCLPAFFRAAWETRGGLLASIWTLAIDLIRVPFAAEQRLADLWLGLEAELTVSYSGDGIVALPGDLTPLCVVGRLPGEVARVRTGPGAEFDLVGELAFDQTKVMWTGATAVDRDGDEWREIIFNGEARWVVARFLTPGACSVGQPVASYSVTGIPCGSHLNVRIGIDEPYEILTQLAPDATGVSGTGVMALDPQGRTWVQVTVNGLTGWAAGWFLVVSDRPQIACTVSSWVVTEEGVGPIRLGMSIFDLPAVTGIDDWGVRAETPSCWTAGIDGIWVLSWTPDGSSIDIITVFDRSIAATARGIRVGDTHADLARVYGASFWIEEDFAGYLTAGVVDVDGDGDDDIQFAMPEDIGFGTTVPRSARIVAIQIPSFNHETCS